jgi:hypothetical protein
MAFLYDPHAECDVYENVNTGKKKNMAKGENALQEHPRQMNLHK